jgi:hypothetical protein
MAHVTPMMAWLLVMIDLMRARSLALTCLSPSASPADQAAASRSAAVSLASAE